MKINELDVIRLKDGREGTVLEVFANPLAYLVETDEEDVAQWPIVTPDQVAEVTWTSKKD